MAELLWTFEKIKSFAQHQDAPVRRWALNRLIELYPDQAGEVVIEMALDTGKFISYKALDFLAAIGEGEKFGPRLLDYFQQSEGERQAHLAEVLGKLPYEPAYPAILAYAQTQKGQLEFRLIEALQAMATPEAKAQLWQWLEARETNGRNIPLIMEALFSLAQAEDIPRLMSHYRTLPFGKQAIRSPLKEIGRAVNVDRLVDDMIRELDDGFTAVLEQADWWFGQKVTFSDETMKALEAAFERLWVDVPQIVLAEAQHILAARGDDVAAWQAAWQAGEQPTNYRRRVLLTLAILQTLVDMPRAKLTPRKHESVLAVALLCQLKINKNEQTVFAQHDTKSEALFALLMEDQEYVLDNLVEEMVALGPQIVPRLLDLFDPEAYGWGHIRIAKIFEKMARKYPGSCDAAISKLIAAINEEQGDFMVEAAQKALEKIGPPAVDPINAALRNNHDLSTQIFLTHALGHIPIEKSAETMLALIQSGQPVEEMHIVALTDLGVASAIEPLYQLWQQDPEDAMLAEDLLVLCTVNDVEKPDMTQWRALVAKHDAKMMSLDDEPFDLDQMMERLQALSDKGAPFMRSWQLESATDKPEKKRSNTQTQKKQKPKNKANRGKKKKKKRRQR